MRHYAGPIARWMNHTASPQPETDSAAAPGAAERVLVVCGTDALGVQVQQSLEALGFAVHGCSSIADSRRWLAGHGADVVLLDGDMQASAGELAQQPNADELAPALVLLTAAGDEAAQREALRLGAVDFVRRPLVAAELQARVRAALRTRTLMRRLDWQATRDRLTGMLNRDAVRTRLAQTLAAAEAGGRTAVLCLDFDGFRLLNDAYGYDAGDELLRQVGERLRRALRSADSVLPAAAADSAGRLGGDDVVVVLDSVNDARQAEAVAARLLAELGSDFWIGGRRIVGSFSIGIAIGIDPAQAASDLLRDAGAALHEARSSGRNRYCTFDGALRARIETRVSTESELRVALEQEQLALHYQPIVSLASGAIAGMEALIRWQHPVRGMIPPVQFIPVAVDSGLIKPIGDWVLQRAAQDFVALRRALGAAAPDFVSVNVSRRQLGDAALPVRVADVIAATGIEAQQLHLEITESELAADYQAVRRTVEALKQLQVPLVVDDFGVGYSSLASLHEFPIDVLKLDRSFLATNLQPERRRALLAVAHAMIQLARNIGLRVVAEGIEEREQLAVLQSLGCDMAQGYLLGRPMPLAALEERLRG
jgi:diguanylate cyclase (GGDEF)-like protein